MPHVVTILLLLSIAPTMRVSAQFGETAQVDAELASSNPVDPTAAGAVVELEGRTSMGDGVQDVLPEVPGLGLQQLGGEAAFVGVSLRGADVNRTDVYIDDIPVGGLDAGMFDLSSLPLGAFERIEVYRGGAPLVFGSSAIGGVVRFVPKLASNSQLTLRGRASSFRTWETAIRGQVAADRVEVFMSGRVFRTRGNYPYVTGATPIAGPGVRSNSDSTSADGTMFLRVHLPRGTLKVLFLGVGRHRGEPGVRRLEGTRTRSETRSFYAAVQWQHVVSLRDTRTLTLTSLASFSSLRFRFTDPLGVIDPLGADVQNKTREALASLTAELTLLPWLEWTVFGRYTGALYAPTNGARPVDPPNSIRHRFRGGAEARFHGRRGKWSWEVRPSWQTEVSRASLRAVRFDGVESTNRTDLVHGFRVGVAAGPQDWFALVASGFRGFRLPTTFEFHGDGGVFVSNIDLEAERSWGFDAGFVAKTSASVDASVATASLDVRGFSTWFDGFLRLSQNAQTQLFHDNEASARSSGIEVVAKANLFAHLELFGQLTWNQTADANGDALARVPRARGYGRMTLYGGPWSTLDRLAFFVDVTHRGARASGRSQFSTTAPSDTWLGAGLRVSAMNEAITFSVAMRDVLDRGGLAFVGFPLPQRRLSAVFEYKRAL